VRLLARAVRARRLVLLTSERWSRGNHLSGVLAVDGRVAARAERRQEGPASDAAVELVRDLLVQARLLEPAPGLLERPFFWVAVAGAVAVAAGVTALVLYEPTTKTSLSF
jgi:hypothetical protein